MTYMNNIGSEEINRRKTVSDAKSATDMESFANKLRGSSHGIAAKINRDRKEGLKIQHIINTDVESESYYDDLLGEC